MSVLEIDALRELSLTQHGVSKSLENCELPIENWFGCTFSLNQIEMLSWWGMLLWEGLWEVEPAAKSLSFRTFILRTTTRFLLRKWTNPTQIASKLCPSIALTNNSWKHCNTLTTATATASARIPTVPTYYLLMSRFSYSSWTPQPLC